MKNQSTLESKQKPFPKFSKSKLVHGGEYRKRRAGRKSRPLSSKHSHHIVFKIQKMNLKNRSFRHPKNFLLVQAIVKKYAKRFQVKIEQISYQHDHIHILARSPRRFFFHHFFRVVSGQIAQNLKVTDTPKDPRVTSGTNGKMQVELFKKTVLWAQRPFTRIVVGLRNYRTTRNYIQLNEKEVCGEIKYRKERLRGLSLRDWQILWA